jgi:isoquinoline 1-oxidoreductase alpha subunit
MIRLRVNDVEQSFDGDPQMPLLWYLRDELGLMGTKFGCGVGLCGACTVNLGGKAIRSCVTAMSSAAESQITTIEGLGRGGLHRIQKAWMRLNVPQCGYCQSGQMMQAAALLKNNHKPNDADIDKAMAGNICRCGTYQKIRAAIKAAAEESA